MVNPVKTFLISGSITMQNLVAVCLAVCTDVGSHKNLLDACDPTSTNLGGVADP